MRNLIYRITVEFTCTPDQFEDPLFRETLEKIEDGTFEKELKDGGLTFNDVTVTSEIVYEESQDTEH